MSIFFVLCFLPILTLPKQQKQLWEKVTLVGMLFFCVSVCVDYFKEFPRFKKLFCLFSSSFLFLKFRNETNSPPPPSVWFSSANLTEMQGHGSMTLAFVVCVVHLELKCAWFTVTPALIILNFAVFDLIGSGHIWKGCCCFLCCGCAHQFSCGLPQNGESVAVSACCFPFCDRHRCEQQVNLAKLLSWSFCLCNSSHGQ